MKTWMKRLRGTPIRASDEPASFKGAIASGGPVTSSGPPDNAPSKTAPSNNAVATSGLGSSSDAVSVTDVEPNDLLPWADPYIAALMAKHRLRSALAESLRFLEEESARRGATHARRDWASETTIDRYPERSLGLSNPN